mmetsp:Transcript_11804/g.22105  ORF Transcript_11804/g.22105 Transcript_11804/m.22105 type:complete len:222 (-) Transcript_11804:60-725(-)
MKLATVITLTLFHLGASKVIKLDDSNFQQMTKEKIVFIKFFAPWCGHCKAMAADWEKLGEEITDPNVLIAEVDCTSDKADEICEENDIQGFPTLKYGDAFALEDYSGERDFEELLSFAKSELKPFCSPGNIDLCDDEQKSIIDKFMAMSMDELEQAVEDIEDKLDDLDSELEENTDKLQEEYVQLMEKKNLAQKQAKVDANYSTLKIALAKQMKNRSSDEL